MSMGTASLLGSRQAVADLTLTATLTAPDDFNIAGDGSIALTAGGTNENITLTPSGNSNGTISLTLTHTSAISTVKALDLVGDLGAGTIGLSINEFAYGTDSNSYGRIAFNRSRGSLASPAELTDGDRMGAVIARGYFNSAFGATAEIDFRVDGTVTAAQRPPSRMEFYTNPSNGAQTLRLTIDALGSFVLGSAAVATNATDGFLYVAACAGTPTGAPTAKTGRIPIVVDSTNHKLYFYSGGSWRDAGP